MSKHERRFPLPIPSGWFALRYSDELVPGQVEAIDYFGRNLVLFRTEAGEAVVFDAFCPHLGTHLGHGGVVEGERLRCPFHGWAFAASGRCVDIPYAARIPRMARTAVWQIVEQSGRIWIWHGAGGESPFYAVPRIPELEGDAWQDHQRYYWSLRTCMQEMSENGADSAHFRFVHDMKAVPELKLSFDGPRTTSSTATRFPGPGRSVEGMIDLRFPALPLPSTLASHALDQRNAELLCDVTLGTARQYKDVGKPVDAREKPVRLAAD